MLINHECLNKPTNISITVKEEHLENQKATDVQAFNRRAATYEESRRQSVIFDRVQNRILHLAENETPECFLDVGCGTGRLLRKAQQRWPDVCLVGVDPAEGMLKQAKELLPKAAFHVSMAESLPLPNASVDVVFSTMSFHHWADQAKGIAEIARVLRPGGMLILADIMSPFGLSIFFRHFKRNNPRLTLEMFVQSGIKVELQRRPWLWSRALVITVGRKT